MLRKFGRLEGDDLDDFILSFIFWEKTRRTLGRKKKIKRLRNAIKKIGTAKILLEFENNCISG